MGRHPTQKELEMDKAYAEYIYSLINKVIEKNKEMAENHYFNENEKDYKPTTLKKDEFLTQYVFRMQNLLSITKGSLFKQRRNELEQIKYDIEEFAQRMDIPVGIDLSNITDKKDFWLNISDAQIQAFLETIDKDFWSRNKPNYDDIRNDYFSFADFKRYIYAEEYEETYWEKTWDYLIYGDFDNDFTLAGLVINILLGIIGVDFPMDIRDLIANVKQKRIIGSIICIVGLIPVIGIIKQLRNAKHLDELAPVLRKLSPKLRKVVIEFILAFNEFYDDIAKFLKPLTDFIAKLKRAIKNAPQKTAQKIVELMEKFDEFIDAIIKNKENRDTIKRIKEIFNNIDQAKHLDADAINDVIKKSDVLKNTDEIAMTGKQLAKKLGFPDAPAGYFWRNTGGKLTLVTHPKNTSTKINTKQFNIIINKFSNIEYGNILSNKKIINNKTGKIITGIEFLSNLNEKDIKIIEKFDNIKNVELKWINQAVSNTTDSNNIIIASNTIQKQIKNNTLLDKKIFNSKRTKTYNLYMDTNNKLGKKGKKLAKELSESSQRAFINKMCKETGFTDDIFNIKKFNENSNPIQKNGWKVTPEKWEYYKNNQIAEDFQVQLKFEHNDGTIIRYKPKGDKWRRCTYSIEIKIDPRKPDKGFQDVAFKLDHNGVPLPLGPIKKIEFPRGSGKFVFTGSNIPDFILNNDNLKYIYMDILSSLGHKSL